MIDAQTASIVEHAVDAVADDVGLERDSWAFERAEQEALDDSMTVELAEAKRRLGYAESAEIDAEWSTVEETGHSLVGLLDDVGDVLESRVSDVAIEACRTEIGSHGVDLRRARRGYCPLCSESTEWYYLGTTTEEDVECVGWVCGYCESDLLESEEDGQIVVQVDRREQEVSEA